MAKEEMSERVAFVMPKSEAEMLKKCHYKAQMNRSEFIREAVRKECERVIAAR